MMSCNFKNVVCHFGQKSCLCEMKAKARIWQHLFDNSEKKIQIRIQIMISGKNLSLNNFFSDVLESVHYLFWACRAIQIIRDTLRGILTGIIVTSVFSHYHTCTRLFSYLCLTHSMKGSHTCALPNSETLEPLTWTRVHPSHCYQHTLMCSHVL